MKKYAVLLLILSFFSVTPSSDVQQPVAPFTKTHLACAWAGVGTLWAGYNLISHYRSFKGKHADATFGEYLAKLRRSVTKHHGTITKKITLVALTAAATLGLHHYCYPEHKVIARQPNNPAEETDTLNESEDEERPQPAPAARPIIQRARNTHSGRPTRLTQELCQLGANTIAQGKQQLAQTLATTKAKITGVPQERAAFLKLINDAITTINESRRARGINVVVDLMTDPDIDLLAALFAYKKTHSDSIRGAPQNQIAAYEKYNCALQMDGDVRAVIESASRQLQGLIKSIPELESEVVALQERVAAEEQKERMLRNHGSPFYVAHVKKLLQQPDHVSCGFYAAWFKNKFDTAASFADLAAGVDDRARTEFNTIFPQWKEQIYTLRGQEHYDRRNGRKTEIRDLNVGEPNKLLQQQQQVNLEEKLAANPFVKACQLIYLPGHFVSLGVIQVPFGNQPHERVRVYVPLDSLSSASRYVPDANFNKYIAEMEQRLFERHYTPLQADASAPQGPVNLTEALERYGDRMAPEHKALLEDVSAHLDL